VRRRLALLLGGAFALVLLAWPAAIAEYRGSDLLGNIGPESQAGGGLVDRYPLSAYALDYHVDAGITDLDGVAPMIAQWAASQLWSATSFLVKCVIDLFTWAFSLDLLGGADGALGPVSVAITSLYENVIGEAWMVAAILIAGIWGIWKALVQRRYTETAGALAVSVIFVLIALFFVYQPQRTIGQASRWTNTLSLAFLSGANQGSLHDPQQAKHQVADHLFETLIYRPWVVLEFGGLSHCVDTDRTDGDGFPRPVSPHDPARDVCRDHLKAGRDGHGGYALRYLKQPSGSEKRKAEYDALREGKLPFPVPSQFAGYEVDKADAPAVDIQQAGGAFQRLTFSVVVFLGALGAVALLGTLSLAVILAQVVALVLLGFAPVALVIGIFPSAGHDLFRAWLGKLATAVFIKALYSLVIALVVAVSAALTAATGSLGFLFAFGLQTLFFWALFVYRKQITARLVAATTGAAHHEGLPRASAVQRGAAAATAPVTALVGLSRRSSSDRAHQESALSGGEAARSPGDGDTHSSAGAPGTTTLPRAPSNGSPHGGSARNGEPPRRTRGPVAAGEPELTQGEPLHAGGPDPAQPPASPASGIEASGAEDGRGGAHEATPRASHEDVMRRARELRERQRETKSAGEERHG
jgi:hypothetical protein